jgi:hypothetical protein
MIPVVEIIRIQEAGLLFDGTVGILRINKQYICLTLELFDKLNKPNESSIPAQQYICQKYFRESKAYWTYRVLDVPGRTAILFHPGRGLDHTEGCVLLGEKLITSLNKDVRKFPLLYSKQAFNTFMAYLEGHEFFHLTIREEY